MTTEREQLAVAQAQIVKANECRIALVTQINELADHIERAEYCISDPDMKKQMLGQREFATNIASQWNQNGNPFASNTSALEAIVKQAGEVMRKRVAKYIWDSKGHTDNWRLGAIRALPGVTMEDLK